MPRAAGTKGKRRNMNLTAETFARIERLRHRKEKELGMKLSWEDFFAVVSSEYERSSALSRASGVKS